MVLSVSTGRRAQRDEAVKKYHKDGTGRLDASLHVVRYSTVENGEIKTLRIHSLFVFPINTSSGKIHCTRMLTRQ